MREDGSDGEASGAPNIHKIAVRRLNQTLKLVLLGL
jgi:hypothetical protein